MLKQTPLPQTEMFQFAHRLRGWREKGAPTHTYPDQREQSWASIYTCLPLGPQSKGSGGHFTQGETDSGEEQHKQEEGEMSKPFAFFYHNSQPNILYYNKVYKYTYSQ